MFAFILGTSAKDTAFQVIGLANQGAVLDWITSKNMIILVYTLAVLGVIITVKRALMAKEYNMTKVILNYLIGTIFLWTFFTAGRVDINSSTAISGREDVSGSEKVTKTSEILGEKFKGGSASPGFLLMIRLLDRISNGFIKIFERVSLGDPNKGMFSKPFSYLIAYLKANEMQIKDPVTRDEFSKFLADCYYRARKKLEAEDGTKYTEMDKEGWPGHKYLITTYKGMKCVRDGKEVDCYDEWTRMKEILVNYVETEMADVEAGILTERYKKRVLSKEGKFKKFYRENILRDDHFTLLTQAKITKYQKKSRWGKVGKAASKVFPAAGAVLSGLFTPVMIGGWAVILTNALPIYKGFLEMVVYSCFPLILLFALLPDGWKLIFTYFMSILTLKVWAIVWCFINISQIYIGDLLLSLESVSGRGVFFSSTIFPMVILLATITSPLIAIFVVKGTVDQIASVTGFTRGQTSSPVK